MVPGVLELITASTPEDPALDIAISHALLAAVASGRRGDVLRLHRPGPTAAFGRLDVLRTGFDAACAVAEELGYTPVVRSAGGHVAPYDEQSLVVEHIVTATDVTAGLQDRFAAMSGLLRDVLAGLGADARVGELAGEYCAGAHSLNVAAPHDGGRLKIAGVAQRAVRGGALTSAIVTVGGGPRLREAVAALYATLELDVEPGVSGALDEVLPGITVELVTGAIRAAYGDPAPVEPDAELLAAARALTPRHAV
jgi:octanoyl-[GcvH]:protein N-octanoyltransferase